MLKKIKRISHFFYYLFQTYEIFYANLPNQTHEDIDEICSKFIDITQRTISLDLGCGSIPKNPFKSSETFGLDLFDDQSLNIKYCRLGFDKMPFADNHFDFITAFDLIEHIPRFYNNGSEEGTPFINLMNEVWRVLKNNGIFLSHTPIYPFYEAFQDPTHNNIITSNTFKMYFSDQKHQIAESYGIKTNFKIIKENMKYRHQVILLQKSNTSI